MIKFVDPGKPCPAARIDEFERLVGAKLPNDYRQFLEQNNGARPESNMHDIDAKRSVEVSVFIPLDRIPRELAKLRSEIPKRCIPIAEDSCGNLFCLEFGERNRVFLWDHEMPDAPTALAESFSSFVELLKPFDASLVELKPGQVISVWVSPELRKRFPPRP